MTVRDFMSIFEKRVFEIPIACHIIAIVILKNLSEIRHMNLHHKNAFSKMEDGKRC